MLTDSPPRKSTLRAFRASHRMRTIDVPEDGALRLVAKSIESEMKGGTTTNVRQPCLGFLKMTSRLYKVVDRGIRVLAAVASA